MSNDSFNESDQLPVPTKTELDEVSYQELMELSTLHIQDVDERVQFDKNDLENVPFIILGWHFTMSEEYTDETGEQTEYAVVTIRTSRDEFGVFADGSTGIRDQLHRYERVLDKRGDWEAFSRGEMGGIPVPRGLRKSEYTKRLNDGSTTRATTFYFDNRDR